jgi:predicted DNA-binding transcriptional regulator YafY
MKYEIRTKRFERLFAILAQLSPYSQVTVHDLATEYNVDDRTIERDLEALQSAKLGIFYDENSSIKISRVGYGRIRSWIEGAKEEE